MTSTVEYTNDLRTVCLHVHSGTQIITDAPLDNHGKGEAFSPTDLTATSLAACILTTVAIAGQTHGYVIDGAKAEVTKHMASDPRRISAIDVIITMPNRPYTDKEKTLIERIGNNCPVQKSLHPDIKQNITYLWG